MRVAVHAWRETERPRIAELLTAYVAESGASMEVHVSAPISHPSPQIMYPQGFWAVERDRELFGCCRILDLTALDSAEIRRLYLASSARGAGLIDRLQATVYGAA